MVKRSLFGTSGIRGEAERFLTNQFCFDIGRSFGKLLAKRGLIGSVGIGMDPRGSSPRITEAVSAGLIYEEREVVNEGATSVPSMNYLLVMDKLYCGSVMVSGSHIKPHLNGIKFFIGKEEILKKDEAQIERIYKSIAKKVKYDLSLGSRVHFEGRAKDGYKEYLALLARKYPRWKVVVDPGDGAQSDTMPILLARLGIDVVEINATIQGEFFSRDTENLEDMAGLMAKVKEVGADFGLGYDSDGDRVVIIDEKGEFVPGDYSGTLIAREFAKDSVVVPISVSQVVDSIGKKIVRTKVGSPYVVEAMKKGRIDFGFEANGGCIFPEMLSRDGGRTTIELLNILAKSEKKVSELVGELPKFYLSKTKVDYKWELQEKILSEAEIHFKGEKVEKMDGLKIWVDKSTWILFRSSQNAPEFRVFAESDSQNKAHDLMKKGVEFVKQRLDD